MGMPEHECEATHCVICCPHAQGYNEGFESGAQYATSMQRLIAKTEPENDWLTLIGAGILFLASLVVIDALSSIKVKPIA